MKDAYRESKVFEFQGMTVHVHFPDITEEERARRMKAIYKAASDLLKRSKT